MTDLTAEWMQSSRRALLTDRCRLQGDKLSDLQEQLDAAQAQGAEQLRQQAELRAEIASLSASKEVIRHQVRFTTCS